MTTVLDRDWTTVSTRLPFRSRRDGQPPAESRDAGLAPEADQMQAGDSLERASVLRELAGEVEAFGFRIGGALAALDRLGRDGDARHMLVDVAERSRRTDEADRGQQRAPAREAGAHRFRHEVREPLRLEADLELEEARAGADLLQGAVDAVVVRRSARVLHGAEEQVWRRLDAASRQIAAGGKSAGSGQQLDRVEIEDPSCLRLVAGGDVVPREAADVLDPVKRGAGELRLEREAIP